MSSGKGVVVVVVVVVVVIVVVVAVVVVLDVNAHPCSCRVCQETSHSLSTVVVWWQTSALAIETMLP